MIGKVYWSTFPFYDSATRRNAFKHRPVLIVSGPRNNDYTVLPVSSVSIKTNIDPEYDIPVDPALYPDLHLTKLCYVRTHKQTIVHRASLTSPLGDMKNDYPDLYISVLAKLEAYNAEIMNQAI